jgi:activating signal cointegrator complex subunit 3
MKYPLVLLQEKLNEGLAKQVRWAVDTRSLDDPHVKTNLLLQAHFTRMELPISDYVTDTKSVLDQSIRVLQAMVDVAANGGWLQTALSTMHLLQMIMQVHANLCLYGYWVPAMDTFVLKLSDLPTAC